MEPKPHTRKSTKPRSRLSQKPKQTKKLVPKGIRVSVAERVKLRKRMDEIQREIEALTREVEAAPLKERVRLRTALHHKEEERDNLYIRLKEANRVTESTLWTNNVITNEVGPNNVTTNDVKEVNPEVDLNAVNADLNPEVDLNAVNKVTKPTLKERRTQNRQTRKQKKALRNMINRMTVREAALENFKTRKARNAERLNLRLAELELQKHQDRLALVKRRLEEERTRKAREEADPESGDVEALFRRMMQYPEMKTVKP